MKTRKIMLPLMAFVCAIGMAFASADIVEDQSTGYIFEGNNWRSVQVDCAPGEKNCRVLLSSDNTIYQVFEADLSTPKNSASDEPIIVD